MQHTDVIANRLGHWGPARHRIVGRVHALFRLAFAAVASARIARRDRRHLQEMPDYMLKDIGIARADIDRAIRQGRL
jgi:uncharacterized protein YjiS (DUF1127 family)